MLSYKKFEEFDSETITSNNSKYNSFLNKISRDKIVAWDIPGSQERNFNMVSKYLKKDESLLDFGCGVGDFVKYLKYKEKEPSYYLGVDINSNFINIAKSSYPDYNFKLINSVNVIDERFDNICAIGVFTWFITKKDFINTIERLYELSNKSLLVTVLWHPIIDIYNYDWNSNYRYYNEELIKGLFPNYNIEFSLNEKTMLIRFIK
jgi:cyclopropane fatty-acyl-phospholipid synthase-like methyltransferase